MIDHEKKQGFLADIGLGHYYEYQKKYLNREIKKILLPALDKVQGKAFEGYYYDGENIKFFGLKSIKRGQLEFINSPEYKKIRRLPQALQDSLIRESKKQRKISGKPVKYHLNKLYEAWLTNEAKQLNLPLDAVKKMF